MEHVMKDFIMSLLSTIFASLTGGRWIWWREKVRRRRL
jgi:hypothetical protein